MSKVTGLRYPGTQTGFFSGLPKAGGSPFLLERTRKMVYELEVAMGGVATSYIKSPAESPGKQVGVIENSRLS